MNHPHLVRRSLTTVFALLALGVLAATTPALAGQRFRIESHTSDGGGNHSQGTRFAVEGTAGQPDAGPTLQGVRFAVQGGFWHAASTPSQDPILFKDSFED